MTITIEQMKEMRYGGSTYRDIAQIDGRSHERIRQLIKDEVPSLQDIKDSAVKEEVEGMNEWLRSRVVVTRNEVLQAYDLTKTQLTRLGGYGLETFRIINSPLPSVKQYTDTDVVDALRGTWSGKGPMSAMEYDDKRGEDTPSSALIVARYGWARACRQSGIPVHTTHITYTTHWDARGVLNWVRQYVDESMRKRRRPTYAGYEKFAADHANAPCGATVRNYMRSAYGDGLWLTAVLASLEDAQNPAH